MIKSITFQGNRKFAANLYALEIKSRFIDQTHADGYYSGYGSELEAKVVGNQIQIGTGAFVVQGRISEVVSTEVVTPTIYNNFVGYVVARIETYHVSDDNNCTFKAYVNTALSEIPLRQEDVYATNADNENLVYELPIYSFEIKDRTITNLQKLIKPIDDYARVQKEVDRIVKSTNDALALVQSATESSEQATMSADNAVKKSDSALRLATEAKTTADGLADSISQANETAQEARKTAVLAKERVDELEQNVISGGTVVSVEGIAQRELSFERDPQSQLDEINEKISIDVYKGDLPEDEKLLDEILLNLISERRMIYRIPKGYNTQLISDIVSESYDNSQYGYVEFLGVIKLKDTESEEPQLSSAEITINVIDGKGKIINLNLYQSDNEDYSYFNMPLSVGSEEQNIIQTEGVYIITRLEFSFNNVWYYLGEFIVSAGYYRESPGEYVKFNSVVGQNSNIFNIEYRYDKKFDVSRLKVSDIYGNTVEPPIWGMISKRLTA